MEIFPPRIVRSIPINRKGLRLMLSPSMLVERRLTLQELARREGVSLSTTWRWILKGVRGRKLESLSVGGRRYTSEEAFLRFVGVELNPATSNSEGSANRRIAIEIAEKELQSP
jgi:hypothetical protein